MLLIRVKTASIFSHTHHRYFNLSFFTFPSDQTNWQSGSIFVLSLTVSGQGKTGWFITWLAGSATSLSPETKRNKISLATLGWIHFILSASTWHHRAAYVPYITKYNFILRDLFVCNKKTRATATATTTVKLKRIMKNLERMLKILTRIATDIPGCMLTL